MQELESNPLTNVRVSSMEVNGRSYYSIEQEDPLFSLFLPSDESQKTYNIKVNIKYDGDMPSWDVFNVFPIIIAEEETYELSDYLNISNKQVLSYGNYGYDVVVSFDATVTRKEPLSANISDRLKFTLSFEKGQMGIFSPSIQNSLNPSFKIYIPVEGVDTSGIFLTTAAKNYTIPYNEGNIAAPSNFFSFNNIDTETIEITNLYGTANASEYDIATSSLYYISDTKTLNGIFEQNILLNQPKRQLNLVITGVSEDTGTTRRLNFIIPIADNACNNNIFFSNVPTLVDFNSHTVTITISGPGDWVSAIKKNRIVYLGTTHEGESCINGDINYSYDSTTNRGTFQFEIKENAYEERNRIYFVFNLSSPHAGEQVALQFYQSSKPVPVDLPISHNYLLQIPSSEDISVNVYKSNTYKFESSSIFSSLLKPLNSICEFTARDIALNYFPNIEIEQSEEYEQPFNFVYRGKTTKFEMPLFKINTSADDFYYAPYYDYENVNTYKVDDGFNVNRVPKKEVFIGAPFYVSNRIKWDDLQDYVTKSSSTDINVMYSNYYMCTDTMQDIDDVTNYSDKPSITTTEYILGDIEGNEVILRVKGRIKRIRPRQYYSQEVIYKIRRDFCNYYGMLYYVNNLGGVDWITVNNTSTHKRNYTSSSISLPKNETNRKVTKAYNYIKNVTDSWTLKTDLLTDEEMQRLHHLFDSQCLKLYIRETGEFFDVNIKESSYTEKTFMNNSRKKFNASFTVESQGTTNKYAL